MGTYTVQFEVEAAGVADGFALAVAAPQSGRHRGAVGARQTRATVNPATALLALALALVNPIKEKKPTQMTSINIKNV